VPNFKNKYCIFILLLVFSSISFSQTNLGSGSYTTNFPGTDSEGRNEFPSGTPQLTGNAANKPVPTNDWWSKLVKENHADNLFNYPMTMKTTNNGLIVTYIPWGVIGDNKAIEVGLTSLESNKTTVSDHSDWTVTMNWDDGNRIMTATSGIGMPFIYFKKQSSQDVEIIINSGDITVNNEIITIKNASNEADFVIYAPSGSSWNVDGTKYSSSLNSKNYWSILMLPQSTTNISQEAEAFKDYAYVFPTNTKTSWSYDNKSSIVTTDFEIETETMEGSKSIFLQGLLPHQWDNLSSDSPKPNFKNYTTVRGELKTLKGNKFTVKNKFSGILSTLPYLNQYSDSFNPGELDDKIKQIENNKLDSWTDSYNEGQMINRLVQTGRIADQIGNINARDKIISTVKERLEDWLTYESGEKAFLFYYNSDWSTLIGYPAGHGQDNNINDHHFHWGYFIHAASFLQQYDPEWVVKWGAMINFLIRDAASTNRSDDKFPFLRNFSPYAGHSWANGFASFPGGNDQESTSESMQFNSSLIHWGTITGQDEIRDLGIYLYTTENTSINEYWFDIEERNFKSDQNYGLVSRVWGNSYDNGTFWTSDITASYGIEFYPIHGGSFYLGEEKNYVEKIWNEIENNTAILNPDSENPNLWYDTFWKYLALIDPEKAINLYNKSPNRNLKFGISDAQTYYWLHSLNGIGLIDPNITADYPIASVFIKDELKTYVAHNYSNQQINVEFSDGFVLKVPAYELITNRAVKIEGTLNSNYKQVYANGKIDLNLTSYSEELTKVDFYQDDELIGSVNEAPYEITTPNLEIGNNRYFAKMYINDNYALSNVIKVQVGEQFPYNDNLHQIPGTIEAGHYDYFEGGIGQNISYMDLTQNNNGDFRSSEYVDSSIVENEGATIGWIASGEWLEYSVKVSESGYYNMEYKYASKNTNGGGPFQLELDGAPITDKLEVSSTDSWDEFNTKTISDIPIRKGEHVLKIKFSGGEFNLGKLTFSRSKDLPYKVPLANAGENKTVVLPESTTTLDGSLSSYEGNNDLNFDWVQIYGSSEAEFDDNTLIKPTISNLIEGVYKFKLSVSEGTYLDSDEVYIIVNQTGNNLPSIKLQNPSNNSYYKQNESIFLNASASDLDGTIEMVEFYQGDQLLYQDLEKPYEFTWVTAQAGTYELTAKAVDNDNGTTVSNKKTVYVEEVKSCIVTGSEAQQGEFSAGYKTTFETIGSDVTVTFELFDTDKNGVVAYLWQEEPFQEYELKQLSSQVFSRTITGLNIGDNLSYACKFAFSGGQAVTKYIKYTVGSDCSDENDTSPPTNFISEIGEITSNSVSFIVNADDDSGEVIYSVKLGNQEKQFKKQSSNQSEITWSGLTSETTYDFNLSVIDPTGNSNSKTYSYTTTTLKSNNTSCSGQLSTSQQGTFDIGFKYLFTTSGTDVIIEFEFLDNKTDLIAYAWKKSPFTETQMSEISEKKFSLTLNNQTVGEEITYACKFAFAGGLSVTPYLTYKVGDNCLPDNDEDGVIDSQDQCPNTPSGVTVDINGCEIFTLPLDNNKVSVTSASCIGNTDGSIGLSVEDASYSYLVTVTGQDDPIVLGGETSTASVTGLSSGAYTVCFKVDGQDAYEQCFEVNIAEPKALSAFVDVDNDSRKTSIQLSGSSSYNVEVNGQRYDVKGNSFTTDLPTGLSIIKISTDLDCQGVIEREIFISEDILYYPNPTKGEVDVYVNGEDSKVTMSVFSSKGNLIFTREQEIQSTRKTDLDLGNVPAGTYLVTLDGPTVRKTFKIVKR